MNDYILKLSKPYQFEGKTYNEIDLSEIENLTCKQMQKIEKRYLKERSSPILSEMTLAYSVMLAVEVTQKTVEFFENMPARECGKLKNMVMNFLYPSDTKLEEEEQSENV